MLKSLIVYCLFITQVCEALDPTYLVSDFSLEDLNKMPKDLKKVARYCSIRKFNLIKDILEDFFIKEGLGQSFLDNSKSLLNALKKYSLAMYKKNKKNISLKLYSNNYPIKDYIYYDFLDLFMWERTPTGIINLIKSMIPDI